MPRAKMSQKSALALLILERELNPPESEYRFAGEKGWAFDWAWPNLQVAVEWEGGAWIQGRHTRPKGFIEDMRKYNTAASLGWHVLRFAYSMLEHEYSWVERTIHATIDYAISNRRTW